MVRSAIESIKQELRDRHGHHRSHEGAQMERKHKRTVSESTELSGTPATKRACLRKSDGHLSLAEELDLLEERSTSPSLSTTDEEDVNYGDDKKGDGKEEERDGKEMAEIEMERLPLGPTDVEDNPDNVAIISDSDEEGLDSTLGEDDDDNDDDDIDIDEEEEEGKEVEEQETREVNDKPRGQSKLSVSAATEMDLEEEMKQYLPPPCPLEYAENPLLHMSPQVGFHLRTSIF
ncbi:hypothetical protein EmuJ_000496100 [Echinococcus multilocularis]|uniref:Uncharacterized protein n=1 Tax=Echinococcus multilocularis TaxID=6211 RepID=A0A068XZN2_ECHMU|nr:hypothetical protein EmuJ_000496100 [Echinococcus multilocularis]